MKHESTAKTQQNLLNDLRALISEAQAVSSREASAQSDDIISALRERFEAAQERFSALIANTTEKIVATAKSTDKTVRTNLYLSLVIAFNSGFIIGLLVERRRHY